MNEETSQIRIAGLVLLCIGISIYYLDYVMRHGSNGYYPVLTMTSPLLIGFSLILLIENPKRPIERSVFNWVCLLTGTATGFWNTFF